MQHKSHSYVVFKFLVVKNLMTWQECRWQRTDARKDTWSSSQRTER